MTRNDLQEIINKFTDDYIVFTNLDDFRIACNIPEKFKLKFNKTYNNGQHLGLQFNGTNNIYVNVELHNKYKNVKKFTEAQQIMARKYLYMCKTINDCIVNTLLHELNHHLRIDLTHNHSHEFYKGVEEMMIIYKNKRVSVKN